MSENINIPLVINTWKFTNAAAKAWDVISKQGGSALDAVEEGCSQCEREQCDFTVGFGGSPDESGETTLDAMIMDGSTHDVGAVADLRRIKNAISVARRVLENTNHTLLVGHQATEFAIKMGFKEENLSTPDSIKKWEQWKEGNCQPNYWKNVMPDPKHFCGPYKRCNTSQSLSDNNVKIKYGEYNHDTVGMIVIDKNKKIAAGTSSNGAIHKIPGRVGDSPIPGSGAYVDQDVGGAAATGDGDVMMRFCPSYNAVEKMRNGMSPTDAAQDSIRRIVAKYPSFSGAIIAATIEGEFGAACHGMEEFPFSIINPFYGNVTVKYVSCL
ncbi:N(4)-(Beta-N-acetylglucosaminyl)-L-asparaginase-like isoform X2 [Uloborus diversus]|nr:N(4)-(Beta-N-acetylglucosaminyl)-L-asparaginase-like isoform X2 [Uloborus diversus]